MKSSKGSMRGKRIKCRRCGQEGYVKIDKKPSGQYLRVLHLKECYIGKIKEEHRG